MGQRKRNQKGFSLIELLIVVAIILVIAAIAIPNLLRREFPPMKLLPWLRCEPSTARWSPTTATIRRLGLRRRLPHSVGPFAHRRSEQRLLDRHSTRLRHQERIQLQSSSIAVVVVPRYLRANTLPPACPFRAAAAVSAPRKTVRSTTIRPAPTSLITIRASP